MTVGTSSCAGSDRHLYIFGCGGHGREVASIAVQMSTSNLQMTFLVDDEKYLSPPVNGTCVKLFENVVFDQNSRYVVAIGDPVIRRAIAKSFDERGVTAATLIHPRAEISGQSQVGDGAIVFAGSIVSTSVRLGQHAHVNLACTLSHDVALGEFATLSPGVNVAGHVEIGRDVFVGVGASIISGTSVTPLVIGDGAIIAAGACVVGSVEPGALMAGVPAVRKR